MTGRCCALLREQPSLAGMGARTSLWLYGRDAGKGEQQPQGLVKAPGDAIEAAKNVREFRCSADGCWALHTQNLLGI